MKDLELDNLGFEDKEKERIKKIFSPYDDIILFGTASKNIEK